MAKTGKDQEIRFLVELLDDESETVRQAIGERLFAMRAVFWDELRRCEIELSDEHRRILGEIFRGEGRVELVHSWMERQGRGAQRADPGVDGATPGVDLDCLEGGLSLLSDFLGDYAHGVGRLPGMLDDLEQRIREKGAHKDVSTLTEFLFCSGRFTGNRGDYYGPQNSDLAWVLEHGKGNPISLACLLILIGRRCGFSIGGCNYPGHFLAHVKLGGEILLVDCFNRGKMIPGADLIEHQPFASHEVSEAVQNPASAEAILKRILRNLETAFSRLGGREDQRLVRKLLLHTLG